MAMNLENETGSAATLPVSDVANLVSLAISPYQSTAPAAIELAAHKLILCFGVSHGIARTVAELAGMGGN